ncbi:hypothetical protein BAQU_1836 [Bifidobacterium aquikefiri]|uniref:Uncharacterized protein n=1 Tax=Bifidobacterium aquikefiri TaxID=1653207 RepID=A0A261G298_9BIFI|nr:hypothetical protein BAQU_1836 [Bifidobacterium aquikefiri]
MSRFSSKSSENRLMKHNLCAEGSPIPRTFRLEAVFGNKEARYVV